MKANYVNIRLKFYRLLVKNENDIVCFNKAILIIRSNVEVTV